MRQSILRANGEVLIVDQWFRTIEVLPADRTMKGSSANFVTIRDLDAELAAEGAEFVDSLIRDLKKKPRAQ